MKYAYTYNPSEITEFVGPFKSYDLMKKSIISLAHEDDWNVGDVIEDYLFDDEESLMSALNIHIYSVNEERFGDVEFKELCDLWKDEIKKRNERWTKEREANRYDHDKEEYERLKKKFEGE